jgi:hypothetical protein
MKVDPRTPSFPQPAVSSTRRDASEAAKVPSAGVTPARTDSVRLSSTAKSAAGARIAEIQARISSGYYDSAQVVDAVARSIVASGDL